MDKCITNLNSEATFLKIGSYTLYCNEFMLRLNEATSG